MQQAFLLKVVDARKDLYKDVNFNSSDEGLQVQSVDIGPQSRHPRGHDHQRLPEDGRSDRQELKVLQPQDNDEEAAFDCAKLRPGGNYLAIDVMNVFTSLMRVFARAKPEDKLEIVKHCSARVPSQS